MPTEKSQETAQGLKRFKEEIDGGSGDVDMSGPGGKRVRNDEDVDLGKILKQGQANKSSSSTNAAAANAKKPAKAAVSNSGVPMAVSPTDAEDDGSFWFYYMDAYEEADFRRGEC